MFPGVHYVACSRLPSRAAGDRHSASSLQEPTKHIRHTLKTLTAFRTHSEHHHHHRHHHHRHISLFIDVKRSHTVQ